MAGIGNCEIGDAPLLPEVIPDHSITRNWNQYVISGSLLTEIVQTEADAVWKTWNLGKYQHTTGESTFYDGGTWCGAISAERSAKIQWRCGTRNYEIIEFSEPSTCFYLLTGELRCNNLTCKVLVF